MAPLSCALCSASHIRSRGRCFSSSPHGIRSAISVLPQLWVMMRRSGGTAALTSHFVAVMGVSRVLSGSYMWYAYKEIDCKPWIGNFNHAGYAVLGAHAVHLLLLGDFAYFYLKNVTKSGLRAPLDLSESW